METEIILARIRATMGFSEETFKWLRELPQLDIEGFWFKKEGEILFFSEFKRSWEEVLINSSEPIIQEYFLELGIPKDDLPKVRVYKSYSGSWMIDATIVMAGSAGTVYVILKSVSEIPKIVDGLTELINRLKRAFTEKVNKAVNKQLKSSSSKYTFPPPPTKPLSCDYDIDPSPLKSLTDSSNNSDNIHQDPSDYKDKEKLEPIMSELRGIFISKLSNYDSASNEKKREIKTEIAQTFKPLIKKWNMSSIVYDVYISESIKEKQLPSQEDFIKRIPKIIENYPDADVRKQHLINYLVNKLS